MKTPIKLIISLAILTLTYSNSYCQYNNNFEEDIFSHYEEKSADVFDLLNAVNYNEELYNKGKILIDEHIRELKSKNLQIKPLKKQIQTIYKTTHSKFFKKYETKALFNNIFENGSYNCVTATALYGIIFNAFDINYSIRETPTHVYIIADTLGLQTLIESTLPGSGVMTFNEKYKKDLVEYLNENKIISDLEFESTTTEELFKKYYSKDKTINIFELAALQYYNMGIFLMEEDKFSGAATYLKKAEIIYPSTAISYNRYAAIQNALANDYNKKSYDGNLFGQFINSDIKDSSLIRTVTDYFNNISLELCINSPDINRYDTFYGNILSQCAIEKIPAEIQLKHHYFKAYNYGITGNYPASLSQIKKAYILDEDNLMVKELARETGINHLFLETRFKNQIDSFEYYFAELPFLLSNSLFQQQYVYYYMKVISDCFLYDNPDEGIIYYDRFLKAFDNYNIENYSDEHIGICFTVVSAYYLENENYTKALQIIDKGFELAPESLRLKQIKAEIENVRQRAKNKQKNSSSNYDIPVVYMDQNFVTPDELNKNVNEYFPGKWKAVSIIIEDMEQDLTTKESFEFDAKKNKDCTYSTNGIKEIGKWAYRKNSKCIYFVPDSDKDKYKVFKVKEMSADKIIILPYKDQKKPSPYSYILKPIK